MRTLFSRPSVRQSTTAAVVLAILGAAGYFTLGLRSDQGAGPSLSTVQLEAEEEDYPDTPLVLAIDDEVAPTRASIASLPGEDPRPVGRINDAGDVPMDLVLGEVVVTYTNSIDLEAFVDAVNGEVVDRFDDEDEEVRDALVRFGVLDADPVHVAVGMAKIETDVSGDWSVSDDGVLDVFRAVVIAHELGLVAMPNTLHEPTGILDGSTLDGNGPYGDDAMTYPYIASGTAQDIGLDRAWRLLADTDNLGKVVRIMIHDQGFSLNQDSPDARWIRDAAWGEGASTSYGATWHGAMVANAAMGKVDNGFGGAGPAGPTYAQLVAVGDAGSSWSTIRRLVDLVDEYRPQILNMSWSGTKTSSRLAHQDFFERKFKKIQDMGTLSFASAGNDNRNIDWKSCGGCIERRLVFPCEAHHVRCVGGMGEDTTARAVGGCSAGAPGSNWGTNTGGRSVEIWGPYFVSGQRTNSGNPGRFCGTSFASPFVAGVAGLVHAADPDLGPEGIWDIMKQAANDGGLGSEVTGHQRRVNAADAIERALGGIFLPPSLEITSPGHDDEFTLGDFIDLDADATDWKGRSLEITWSSDRDGVIGSSKVGLGTDNLSEGTHFITARASDNLGDIAQQMLMITIVDQPTTVKIVSPTSGEETWFGQKIFLAGTAEDPDLLGWSVPGEDLAWTVSPLHQPQQRLWSGSGKATSIPANVLPPGIYVVRLSAKVDGHTTSVQHIFHVKVPPTGAIPNAVIVEPRNLDTFGFGGGVGPTIHFKGHGIDAEDGLLSGTRLRWTAVSENGTRVVLCTGSDVPDDEEPKEPGLWLQGNGGVQPGPQFKAVVDCSEFDAQLGLDGEIGDVEWTIELEAFDTSGGPAGSEKVLVNVHLAVA